MPRTLLLALLILFAAGAGATEPGAKRCAVTFDTEYESLRSELLGLPDDPEGGDLLWFATVRVEPSFNPPFAFRLLKARSGLHTIRFVTPKENIFYRLIDLRKTGVQSSDAFLSAFRTFSWSSDSKSFPGLEQLGDRLSALTLDALPPNELVLDGTVAQIRVESIGGSATHCFVGRLPARLGSWIEDVRKLAWPMVTENK